MSVDRLHRIGIIGAGQMGGGIAHVCALAGLDVVVTDINDEALQRGRVAIDRNLSRQVSRGKIREEDTFAVTRELSLKLGKTPVAAEDFPAFIVNRILLPMINEAVYTLYEGVGSVEAIDTAMKLGANHPMGPLELADFIGLDTCLSVMQVLYEGLADSKYRPCPLLVKYVEAGWLGRKADRGFYDYHGATPVPTR